MQAARSFHAQLSRNEEGKNPLEKRYNTSRRSQTTTTAPPQTTRSRTRPPPQSLSKEQDEKNKSRGNRLPLQRDGMLCMPTMEALTLDVTNQPALNTTGALQKRGAFFLQRSNKSARFVSAAKKIYKPLCCDGRTRPTTVRPILGQKSPRPFTA